MLDVRTLPHNQGLLFVVKPICALASDQLVFTKEQGFQHWKPAGQQAVSWLL